MDSGAVYVGHQSVGIGNIEYRTRQSMGCPHYHNSYEVYLQIEGERYITIKNVRHHLVAGDLVLIEPYVMHITESRESTYCRRYVMNIYPEALLAVLSQQELEPLLSGLHTFIVHLEGESFEKLLHMLDAVYEYRLREDSLGRKLLYASAVGIMDFSAGLETEPLLLRAEEGGGDNTVLKALEYIHSHYREAVTLDFMAGYVSMSKSNFCLVFHKAVGETFTHYLNHVRISQAHRLVCETKLPVCAIAERTGFSSASYMISVFKKFTGKTPQELRKEYAGQ